jgi:hypothetical protein
VRLVEETEEEAEKKEKTKEIDKKEIDNANKTDNKNAETIPKRAEKLTKR